MKGRPPLPPGQKRDTIIRMRVRPDAAKKFKALCAQRGVTQSEALRQAINQWMRSR